MEKEHRNHKQRIGKEYKEEEREKKFKAKILGNKKLIFEESNNEEKKNKKNNKKEFKRSIAKIKRERSRDFSSII